MHTGSSTYLEPICTIPQLDGHHDVAMQGGDETINCSLISLPKNYIIQIIRVPMLLLNVPTYNTYST